MSRDNNDDDHRCKKLESWESPSWEICVVRVKGEKICVAGGGGVCVVKVGEGRFVYFGGEKGT